ncbi:hypothetical protein D3C87_1813290 [compost metagenome]
MLNSLAKAFRSGADHEVGTPDGAPRFLPKPETVLVRLARVTPAGRVGTTDSLTRAMAQESKL